MEGWEGGAHQRKRGEGGRRQRGNRRGEKGRPEIKRDPERLKLETTNNKRENGRRERLRD